MTKRSRRISPIRRIRGGYFRVVIATLAIVGSGSASANDIVDFLKGWGRHQEKYDDRQEQWDGKQRDRYRPRPTTAVPQPAVPFRLPVDLTLPSNECGLDPGRYDFALYGGQQMHLNVTGTATNRVIGANPTVLLSEARTLKPHVDIVVDAVRNVGDRDLYNKANDADRELDRVIRELERSDTPDAKEHFQHFNEDWTEFSQGLANYRVGYQLRQHIEAIQRHTNRLDLLFRERGSRWDYDRPRLYGLSRVLSDKVAQLDRGYTPNPTQWQSKALSRQIGRVHFCADSFAEAIRDNANFDTIVDEYRIFDDAWHYVLSRSGQLGQYTPQLVTIGRDIWEIDSALADVLLIDPPAFSDEQAAEHVVDRFSGSARRLQREVELANLKLRDRGLSSWGLVQECGRLRSASESLESAIRNGRSLASCRGEFAELADAWKQLKRQVNSTARTRLPSGMTDFLAAMDRDYMRIEQSVSANYRWRYASLRP